MRGLGLLLCVLTSTAVAQEPTPPAPPAPAVPESTRAESVPPRAPPPPTVAQQRYIQGLRTAGRGVAQLKDGVNRVSNAGHDALRLKQAARRLGGLCGAARGFMASGRLKMQPTAYEDSTRLKARALAAQIDTLIRSAVNCEANAAKRPDTVETDLRTRIPAYEAAWREFRTAIGLPNR